MSDTPENNLNQTSEAVRNLLDGYMCSEAILKAYAKDFGLDETITVKLASGFAGGMAQGDTCGAVTGAIMAIGLKYGTEGKTDQYARDRLFLKVQEFSHQFRQRRDTLVCGKILIMNGIDPTNPEDMKTLRDKNVCNQIVADAVDILEIIFNEIE